VLYYDTDSVIYADETNPNHKMIQTGDFLGEFTDELNGHYITEFISTGPKSYAYKTSNGDVKCKVKGFSLNFENSKHLNFEQMKGVVFGDKQRICLINESMITRKNRQVLSIYSEKDFMMQYDKRMIQNVAGFRINPRHCIETLPWGYVNA